MTYYTTIESPVGELLIVSDGTHITRIAMEKQKYAPDIAADWVFQPDLEVLAQAARQLSDYFAQKLRRFDLPLAFSGTEFQQKVWRELLRIGYGETISYGELARVWGLRKLRAQSDSPTVRTRLRSRCPAIASSVQAAR